jgi:hypothetical protein
MTGPEHTLGLVSIGMPLMLALTSGEFEHLVPVATGS